MGQNESFLPQRLLQARKITGYTLRGLSDALGGNPSHTMLSRYEKGTIEPSSETLLRIAAIAGVSIDFFYTEPSVSFDEIHFRKRSKLSKTATHAIEEKSKDYFSRYFEIETITNNYSNFNIFYKSYNDQEIENISLELRNKWNLGEEPINNLMQTLENNGIKIFIVETDIELFDGFSGIPNNTPVIVIASWLQKQNNLPRMRMSLAHELGHIVLGHCKKNHDEHIECEPHANRFASSFLMPKESFTKMFGGKKDKITLSLLLPLKSYFGVSLPAIIMRAFDLDLIGENTKKRFFIYYNKNGYRQKEPGKYFGKEESSRFELLVLSAVLNGEISRSKGLNLLGCDPREFNKKIETTF